MIADTRVKLRPDDIYKCGRDPASCARPVPYAALQNLLPGIETDVVATCSLTHRRAVARLKVKYVVKRYTGLESHLLPCMLVSHCCNAPCAGYVV
jgi:hypothetical protein